MLDENYGETPSPRPDAAQAPQGDGKGEGEGQTFLVPKAACPGMKPGDSLKARIVAVHGEEYSCEYVPEEAEAPADQPNPGMEGGPGPGAGQGDPMYS